MSRVSQNSVSYSIYTWPLLVSEYSHFVISQTITWLHEYSDTTNKQFGYAEIPREFGYDLILEKKSKSKCGMMDL